MLVSVLRSKILRAEVTECSVDYEGSLAIDQKWMDLLGLLPYEKILVGNITNGERLETYAIPAPAGSLTIALNGAAAHKGQQGDLLVIMAFGQMTEEEAREWKPRVIVLGEHNTKITRLTNPLVAEGVTYSQ